jgi:hypothetical protein
VGAQNQIDAGSGKAFFRSLLIVHDRVNDIGALPDLVLEFANI